MVNAEIVSIGTELLLGQIVDTNSSWMAERLTDLGVNLFYKTIVGDNPSRMEEVIEQALQRSNFVITGGGLGPTQDDLTRDIIAKVVKQDLILDPHLSSQIKERFNDRGLIMTPNNERQALIPKEAIPVPNPNGTAPAFIVEDPKGVIFALPGVPFELKWLFENEVIPYLRKRFDINETITYKVLKVAEIGESSVDDKIGHLIANSSNPTVGVLAHPGQVDVRIAAKADNANTAMRLIAPVEKETRELLGHHIFAEDSKTMEGTVGELMQCRNVTVAVHEDMTGGLVSDRMQQTSPDHFLLGVSATNKDVIQRMLSTNNVGSITDDPTELTNKLASAIRLQSGSHLGLALHAESNAAESVENLGHGQTYISVTDGTNFKTRMYNYAGKGRPDRTRMSLNALDLLRTTLLYGFDDSR